MVDLPKLVLNSPDSYSSQITQILRDAITTGRLQPGAALPTRRELVGHFGVAHMTVASAITTLRTEGWVVSRTGKGVYVRTDLDLESDPWGEETLRVAITLVRAVGGEIRIPEELRLPAPGWRLHEWRDPVTREWVLRAMSPK